MCLKALILFIRVQTLRDGGGGCNLQDHEAMC